MGSTNRDYMRDDFDSKPPSWGRDVPTTKWLIVVTVVTFFLQSILTHGVGFGHELSYIEEWFELDHAKVYQGQVWRLVSYVFVHDRSQPLSLVFNMIGVWFLGSCLERMYGSREILWFYLGSALVSGMIFCGFGLKLNLPFPLYGAGPCVLALLTLFATHFPTQEILVFWVVPIQIRILLWIYVAVDIYQITRAYSGIISWEMIAYMSDLWGMVFAYLYRRQKWRFERFAELLNFQKLRRSMRRATTARNLKVFQPEPVSNLDDQVDAILAKIHESGFESLTDRERGILQRASEQAKNRL